MAIEDAYKRLIAPAVERDVRAELTERAEDEAMKSIWQKSGATAFAAADRRAGRARLGPGISNRL